MPGRHQVRLSLQDTQLRHFDGYTWQDNPESADEKNTNHSINLGKPCSRMKEFADKVSARLVLYLLLTVAFFTSGKSTSDLLIMILYPTGLPAPTGDCRSRGDGERDMSHDYLVFGSFYWIQLLTSLAAGVLVFKIGPKRMLGFSLTTMVISTFLASVSNIEAFQAALVFRLMQGVASALTWPAIYAIIGSWIPSHEIFKFMTCFYAWNVGVGLSFYLNRYIIRTYSWRYIFLVSAVFELIWSVLWKYFAFDEPRCHPRLTREEANHILLHTQPSFSTKKDYSLAALREAYSDIIGNSRVWAIIIANFGTVWVSYILMFSLPLYMETKLGYDVENDLIIMGSPYVLSYFSAVAFCYLADFVATRELLPLVAVRKFFAMISLVFPGFLLISIAFMGTNTLLVTHAWLLAIMIQSASSAGAMANVFDIAPHISGPLVAFCQIIYLMPNIYLHAISTFLTSSCTPSGHWKLLFYISGIISIFCYLIYHLLASSDNQNFYPKRKNRRKLRVHFSVDM